MTICSSFSIQQIASSVKFAFTIECHFLKIFRIQCAFYANFKVAVHNVLRRRTHFFHKDERPKFMKSDLSVAGTISCWNSMISTIIQSHWNGWGFDTQTKNLSKVNVSAQSQLWFGIPLLKPTVLRSLDSLENHVVLCTQRIHSEKKRKMIYPTFFRLCL